MKLFLVVLGGRIHGCNVEQHDVRWVVGKNIESTIPELIKQWIGERKGLHIDSYRQVDYVDGHKIKIITEQMTDQKNIRLKLWFVNIGGYNPKLMAEQHHFGLIVASSHQEAKYEAKRRWLKGLDKIHKDDIIEVSDLRDILPIKGHEKWQLQLIPTKLVNNFHENPDWYGYWKI